MGQNRSVRYCNKYITILAIMMFIALFACLSVCLAAPSDDQAWQDYKLEFGKVYTEEEDASRHATWKSNLEGMAVHNAQYEKTYTQGPNEFSDMTDEEFQAAYCNCLKIPEDVLNGTADSEAQQFVPPSNVQLPASVNWVNKGYVTPVKNQGQCGSCYSFSATGSLEGQWFKKTGRLPSLSEQQIVDCSGKYGNLGCGGGWYEWSWKYLQENGGSESERAYPYYGRRYYCQFRRQYVVAQVRGFHDLPQGDENALKQALATIGPIAVAIDASHRSFGSYKRGVYYEPSCGSGLRNLIMLSWLSVMELKAAVITGSSKTAGVHGLEKAVTSR